MVEKSGIPVTLIWMAGGIYDSQNFEQIQLKWPEEKILFIQGLFLSKCITIISY
jgi:hypothetical protein